MLVDHHSRQASQQRTPCTEVVVMAVVVIAENLPSRTNGVPVGLAVVATVNKPNCDVDRLPADVTRRVNANHFSRQQPPLTSFCLPCPEMSLQNRPFSRTSLYDATTTANTNASSTASQQPAARFLPPHILTSRIAEKQAEYENLSQLRDLSAALAAQMENLESKLQCLADGTESTPHKQPRSPTR